MQSINIGKLNRLDYSAEAAYKALVSKLFFCGKEVKAVAVTSIREGEGKTTVAVNLARTLAEAGKNVLFVDADMRNSVFVSRYKISKVSGGLSHFLSGQKELDDVMYTTNVDGLYVLTAGALPSNPVLLVRSAVFANFIRAAKEKFDYVIIDTPAEEKYMDADAIATVCDGMCLVTAAGKLRGKRFIAVKDKYEEAGCNFLGVVLNKVKDMKKQQLV